MRLHFLRRWPLTVCLPSFSHLSPNEAVSCVVCSGCGCTAIEDTLELHHSDALSFPLDLPSADPTPTFSKGWFGPLGSFPSVSWPVWSPLVTVTVGLYTCNGSAYPLPSSSRLFLTQSSKGQTIMLSPWRQHSIFKGSYIRFSSGAARPFCSVLS